jgi:adenine deaminase
VPGFIDTHLHVESSLVTPLEFERCVLPHGVTTAICDPHEIANVLGVEGIAYFLAAPRRCGWICACSSRAACRRRIWRPPAQGSRPATSRR